MSAGDAALDGPSCWTTVLKDSFGKSDAHSLTAYVPLLVPYYIPGGLIGVMGPIHHMGARNMAVLSCNVHTWLFISWPIICGTETIISHCV